MLPPPILLKEVFERIHERDPRKRASDRRQVERLADLRRHLERMRQNDSYLRQLLAEALMIMAQLEAAIARHDVVAEAGLASRASSILAALDQRIGIIGAKSFAANFSEIRMLLTNSVEHAAEDLHLERHRELVRSTGEVVDRIRTPDGVAYVVQRSGDRDVVHPEEALDHPPALGDNVTVEYRGEQGMVKPARSNTRERSGERTRSVSFADLAMQHQNTSAGAAPRVDHFEGNT
jgi:hypothetical protein